jgi:hypothetical protein
MIVPVVALVAAVVVLRLVYPNFIATVDVPCWKILEEMKASAS